MTPCRTHPSMQCLPHKMICTLCEDWSSGSVLCERDLAAQHYEQRSLLVSRGASSARTKQQYQRLLKQRGLTDDISPKELVALNRSPGTHQRVQAASYQRLQSSLFDRACRLSGQTPRHPIPQNAEQQALLGQLHRVFS